MRFPSKKTVLFLSTGILMLLFSCRKQQVENRIEGNWRVIAYVNNDPMDSNSTELKKMYMDSFILTVAHGKCSQSYVPIGKTERISPGGKYTLGKNGTSIKFAIPDGWNTEFHIEEMPAKTLHLSSSLVEDLIFTKQ